RSDRDWSSDVCSSDLDLRATVVREHLVHGGRIEERRDGRYPARVRRLADIGRLDADDAVPGLLEVRQESPVVRPDVDDEVVLFRSEERRVGKAGRYP